MSTSFQNMDLLKVDLIPLFHRNNVHLLNIENTNTRQIPQSINICKFKRQNLGNKFQHLVVYIQIQVLTRPLN